MYIKNICINSINEDLEEFNQIKLLKCDLNYINIKIVCKLKYILKLEIKMQRIHDQIDEYSRGFVFVC